jgi:hypothetical protein
MILAQQRKSISFTLTGSCYGIGFGVNPGIGLPFSGVTGFAEGIGTGLLVGIGTGLFDGAIVGTGLLDGTGRGAALPTGTGFGLKNVAEGAGVVLVGVGVGFATSM